jgi:hypothetical protein
MLTAIFGLASLLAMCALGFVLGRVWEIRQELRLKTGGQAPNLMDSQLNDRFWAAFKPRSRPRT